MDENLHNIDDLFRKGIERHRSNPSPQVWENLDRNLSKKQAISISARYKKLKWVAAALLIFSAGMAMYTISMKMQYRQFLKADKTRSNGGQVQKESPERSTFNQPDSTSADVSVRGGNLHSQAGGGGESNLGPLLAGGSIAVKKTPIRGNFGEHSFNQPNSAAADVSVGEGNLHFQTTGVGETNPGPLLPAGRIAIRKTPTRGNSREDHVAGGSDHPVNDEFVELGAGSTGISSTRQDLTKITAVENSTADPMHAVSAMPGREPAASSPTVMQSFGDLQISIKSPFQKGSMEQQVSSPLAKLSKHPAYSVQVFFSTGKISTQLVNYRQHFREDDRQQIKATEDNTNSYNVGFTVERRLTGNLGMGTGLVFSTRYTNISSKFLFARPDNRGSPHYRINSSSGYAFLTSKASTNLNSGDSVRLMSSKSTLRYVSIPVIMRYHLNKGKFSINPGLAFTTNILAKAKIETDLSTIGGREVSTISDVYGLRPVYFDGAFSIDLAYNIFKTVSINFSPGARFGLTSITNDGPVKTYVNSLDLALGIKVAL